MTQRNVVHATTVVEHRFTLPPDRVFNAWADTGLRVQWDFPGDADWTLVELDQNFNVGGHEYSRFGPKGNAVYWSRGTFLDIVPNSRIISAGTMHEGDKRISTTLCTIEFRVDGPGTNVVLTDQSAFLDGVETPSQRKSGWTEILARLALFLNASGPRQ